MDRLLKILDAVPEFGALLSALDSGGCPAAVSGLAAVHRAHFAAGLRARTGRPVAVGCADETEAAPSDMYAAPEESAEDAEPEPVVLPVDFAALQEVNPDIYAWLEIPGTTIDQPVLQHPTD